MMLSTDITKIILNQETLKKFDGYQHRTSQEENKTFYLRCSHANIR